MGLSDLTEKAQGLSQQRPSLNTVNDFRPSAGTAEEK